MNLTMQGCLAQPVKGHPAWGSSSAAGRAQPGDVPARLRKAVHPPAPRFACTDKLIPC